MSDLGMTVRVREHREDGTPETTWPPIAGAKVRFTDAGTKIDTLTTTPALTDANGLAIVDAIKFRVDAEGFAPYEGVYAHPNLAGEVPVSLREGPMIPAFHADGIDFVNDAGTRIVLNGADQFFSMRQWLDGVDLEPYGREMHNLGFNMIRVWLSGSKRQNQYYDLIPDERLYQALVPFVGFWNEFGILPLLTVNVDMQDIFPNDALRVKNYTRIADELRDVGVSFLLAKGNQQEKNGFAEHEGPDPRVPWWSNGSRVEDAAPTAPHGTFTEFCQRRDYPAGLMDSIASAVYLYDHGVNVPLLMSEPRGHNEDGSRGRISDPKLAWRFARDYATHWAGAVFKNDAGGTGHLIGKGTRLYELAQAWTEGMRL